MNKILLILGLLCSVKLTDVKPVVYFSNIEVPPINIEEDLVISYEFTAPLEYSDIFTEFSIKYGNISIDKINRYPGLGFQSEFIVPREKLKNGVTLIKLEAYCYAYTSTISFDVETPKKEKYLINDSLNERQELLINSSLVEIGKYGKVSYNPEIFQFSFEETILSNSVYKFDISSLRFKYSLKEYKFNYKYAELIIFGTKDDFPRLYFDEDLGGYVFKLSILEDKFLHFKLDETFYVDYETMMLSSSPGDYFNKTESLYFSKKIRESNNIFNYRINIYEAGMHKSDLAFDGMYKFANEPIGYSSQTCVSILENEVDTMIEEDYKEW